MKGIGLEDVAERPETPTMTLTNKGEVGGSPFHLLLIDVPKVGLQGLLGGRSGLPPSKTSAGGTPAPSTVLASSSSST